MSNSPVFDNRDERNRLDQERVDRQYVREVSTTVPAQPMQPMVSQPVVVAQPAARLTNIDVVQPRDRVRWGPILAGLVSALATLLILSLLGVAVGLTAATGDPNGGAAAAATNNGNNYSTGAAIWAAVSALVAFFIGGFVAARTAAVYGKGNGWINGALVWALALPLLLWLAGNGLSGFLNAVGFNINGFVTAVNNTVANPATNPANNPGTVQSTAESARNGAWGALAALLLGLIAAGLGGFIGSRDRRDVLDSDSAEARQGR